MIHRYTLFGNPIEQSLSPKIHTLFAEQVQRRLTYTASQATVENFANEVDAFQSAGAQGCNITLPLKEEALKLCDKLNEAAHVAGSVNTIKFMRDGTRHGFNRDGSGLLYDLKKNLRLELTGKSVLLIGAGGAARGVIDPLLQAGVASITIANRTLEKAETLVNAFAPRVEISAGDVRALSLESLESLASDKTTAGYDLIINSTSAGFNQEKLELPQSILTPESFLYDLSYSKDATVNTPFLEWAISNGCENFSDGLGMLLEQAADAFFLWEDVRPKTRMIKIKLR